MKRTKVHYLQRLIRRVAPAYQIECHVAYFRRVEAIKHQFKLSRLLPETDENLTKHLENRQLVVGVNSLNLWPSENE